MSEQPHPIIRRLAVKNFRSLADVEVELQPLTVLVGPNGSGKSNLVDVLRFVRDAIARGLDSAILDRGGLGSLRRWVGRGKPPDIQIDLTIVGPTWQGDYGFALTGDRGQGHRVKWERLRFVAGQEKDVHIEFKRGKLVAAKGFVDAPQGNALLEQMTELSSRYLVAFDASRYFRVEGGMTANFVNDMSFYAIFPNVLRAPQPLFHPYPLEESGMNLASVLRDVEKGNGGTTHEALCAALQRVVPEVDRYSVAEAGSYLVTKLHHRTSGGGGAGPAFELARESDGTLRMLGILTALYQEPPRSLLAIEEPEWAVHPGALSLLVDVLREASLRSQVIVTTHSPDLIADVPADALVVVEKEDGVTRAGPVSVGQREAITDKLFDAGELLRIEGLRRRDGLVRAGR
jgi:predicted ATPase